MLTKHQEIIQEASYLLNEFELTYPDLDLDYYFSFDEIISLCNEVRRVFCILFIILKKNKNIPLFYINNKSYFSYNNLKDTFLYEEDPYYSIPLLSLLSFYGWKTIDDWCHNPYYDGCPNENVKNYIRNFFIENGDVATLNEYEEYCNDAFLLTFHNKKLDMVHMLYEKRTKINWIKENTNILSAYNEIEKLCSIFYYPTMLSTYDYSVNKINERYYYSCIIAKPCDEGGYFYEVDAFRYLDPRLIFIVPELDKLIDKFINKWLIY